MSRIAKNPIKISKEVECTFSEGIFSAKGKLGQMETNINPKFNINIVENDGTNYSSSAINGISLNSNVVSNNDDETLNIYVAFEKTTDGSEAVVISGSTLTPMTTSQISALDSATTAKLPSYNYSFLHNIYQYNN